MKLLLADDHTLFRDALVQYIERSDPDAEVSVAKDFHGAYEHMQKDGKQDLILLDLRMPGMDGLQGFEKMRKAFPETPVALMSGIAEPEDVRAAMDLGAVGYFPKTLSGKALLQAIGRVLEGEIFIPTDHKTQQLMPAYYNDIPLSAPACENNVPPQAKQPEKNFKLTPREQEVLKHLTTGASNKEIANHLGLKVVTVKLHVRGICRKLEAKNRTQAALIARENGLALGAG
ncbi:MAG TPA: response regulator transcription factor [Alphaproteobacteria bacterium]|nr:response regulator transcription factor [Alphaproteobacteria bacterium]USO06615.1 MAG: response regulator transcription factor [Rhodospirillales bacterium]HOO80960.1 response regulator transcription factor [Alphaproteobacteria bacterium]